MKIGLVMKRIVILIGVVVSAAAASIVFGQVAEGIITYEVKINMHRTLPPDRQDLKDRIPEFRTEKYQMAFNSAESLYTPILEDDDDDADFSRGGGGRMHFRAPRSDYYTDQPRARVLISREIMGKYYLIEDTLRITAWKFGTGVRNVIGHECRRAMYYDSARRQSIVAWYAPTLGPFLGPELFNSLPGAVLEVNVNDGERIILAKNLDVRPLKKNELKVPSQGTRVTPEAFKKIMDEQQERMRPNGGTMIIRN